MQPAFVSFINTIKQKAQKQEGKIAKFAGIGM